MNTTTDKAGVITPNMLTQEIATARSCYENAKTAPSKAAAHIYKLWTLTIVDKLAIKWLQEQVTKFNAEVDAYNKSLGTLPKGTPKAERRKHNAKKHVQAGKLKSNSKFKQLVKIALDIRNQDDQSIASRFCTVLEWIENNYTPEGPVVIDDIVDAIKAAGGYEKVVIAQRMAKNGAAAKSSSTATGPDNKALFATMRSKAMSMEAVLSTPYVGEKAYSNGELVCGLGRFHEGTLQMVSYATLTTDSESMILPLFKNDLGPTVAHLVQFVADLINLRLVVKEGKASNISEDGTEAGKKLLEERVLWLNNNAGKHELILSTRYCLASVIIVAEPKDNVELHFSKHSMMLAKTDLVTLDKVLEKRLQQYAVSIEPYVHVKPDGKTHLDWKVQDANGTEHVMSWQEAATVTHKPVYVDGFTSLFDVQIGRDQLTLLKNERLSTWKSKKDQDKTKKTMSLTFDVDGGLVYAVSGDKPLKLLCSGTAPTPTPLNFRAGDLYAVVDAVTVLDQEHFTLGVDPQGMLKISWETAQGFFAIYMPTAEDARRLNNKRCAILTATPVAQAA
jgi:hypothetical protein